MDKIKYQLNCIEQERSEILEKICRNQSSYIRLLEKDNAKLIKEKVELEIKVKDEKEKNCSISHELKEARNEIMSIMAHKKAYNIAKMQREYRKRNGHLYISTIVSDGDNEVVSDGENKTIDIVDSYPPDSIMEIYKNMPDEVFDSDKSDCDEYDED